MTWHLIAKGPYPVIVRRIDTMIASGIIWNGRIHAPGTYELPKDTVIECQITVENRGEAGYCDIYIFANGKKAWWWSKEYFSKGERKVFRRKFTVESNVDIEFKVRPTGKDWTDKYG